MAYVRQMNLFNYLMSKLHKNHYTWCWSQTGRTHTHKHFLHFEDPRVRVELYQLEDRSWQYRIVKSLRTKDYVFYTSETFERARYVGQVTTYKRKARTHFLQWYYGFRDDYDQNLWEEVKDL